MNYREEFEKIKCLKCDHRYDTYCKVNRDIPCVPYKEYLEQQLEQKDKVIIELRKQLCKKEEDEYNQDKAWIEEMVKKENYKAIK